MRISFTLAALLTIVGATACDSGDPPPPMPLPDQVLNEKTDGYKGLWYRLGMDYQYGDRYSGGLGNYSSNHVPKAVYVEEANKTFFVYGGTRSPHERHLLTMVSYYDHEKHLVPRPTVVLDKSGVDDIHDNPAIAVDDKGFVWVFVSGRGSATQPRHGYKFRSAEPYSVESFERVAEEEMTYIQPWFVPGRGFFHLFTKYTDGRELYWETSADGRTWSEDHKLAGIEGHFQVSGQRGSKVGTFFNRHPGGGVDRRTDLYYAQTEDFGATWTTVDGRLLDLPLSSVVNPARVIDYDSQDRLQYTLDLNWDGDGNPILLYITSSSVEPGPRGDPREWTITHWNGSEWSSHVITTSNHNMDMGSLYVEEGVWRVIGPTEVGPQPWGTGGEVAIWESRDEGRSWERTARVTDKSVFNHSYVRRPVNARDPFYAFWADGNPNELSESRLYFTTSTGDRLWMLPYEMGEEFGMPIEITKP